MDDARRSPVPLRPVSGVRARVRRVVVRAGLVLAAIVAGVAWPLKLAAWGTPEIAVFLLSVGVATLLLVVCRAIAALLDWRRARRAPPRLRHDLARTPRGTDAWLHVVSGPDRARVAEAAIAVAADLLARGGRVVVMDAGRRLRLHEIFGRERRWGVGECLTGALPVLGLVQDTGYAGLYLLAHGTAARAEDWPQLGRVLDEARPHFARCVLALDAAAPRAAGEALAGRHLEGWWAGHGAATRPSLAFSERTGISLAGFPLPGGMEAALERLHEPSAPGAPLEGVPVAPALRRVSPPPPPPPAVAAAVAAPPSILDCDTRVRERLRFLVWARSLRSEVGRAPEPARAS